MTEANEKKTCYACGSFKEMLKNPKAWWIIAGSILVIWLIAHFVGGFGFRRWFDDSRFDRQWMMQGRWGPRGEFGPGEWFGPGQGCGGNSNTCPFANQTGDQQALSGEQTTPQQTNTGN
jgi:hypothetical protein